MSARKITNPSVADRSLNNPLSSGVSALGGCGLLSAYPELARINDRVWLEAIGRSAHHRFTRGTVLLRRDASNFNQFFLILEGSVRVYHVAPDGRELTLYRVEPGDLCVLSLNALYHNRSFDVVAEASTDVYALGIAAPDFFACLGGSEGFRHFVFSALSGRLCELMCLAQDTAFQNLSMRLVCLLGRLFERAKTNSLNVTHQKLAQELGATREVVSRLLKDLELKGHIRLARGKITTNGKCDFSLIGKGVCVRAVSDPAAD
ncbi:MAG: Crp/Fnr family transcriptional regulator [Gammaproteobacteria bacterium]